MDSSDNSKKSFFKHVFNFDNDSKSEVLNIIQFALLAIIPIVILNKSIQRFVPEADEKKGSLEIIAEVVIQVIVMLLGLLLIDRFITYIPTYSGKEYPENHVIYTVFPILTIALGLQTRLGEKISILVDRVIELWEGKIGGGQKGNNKQGNVKVSQPISGQMNMGNTGINNNQMLNQSINQAAINQSLYGGSTSISQLPTSDLNTQKQQLPNYNNMYQKNDTPLIDAATPGMESFEPMAANSVLGGGFGASW